MIKINLLPHREAKRKLKKTAFIALMVASALVGGMIVMIVGGYNASRISIQNERNAVLTAANAELEKRFEAARAAVLRQQSCMRSRARARPA